MKTNDSVMREKDFENKKNKAIRESTIRDILRDNPPYEYYDIDGKIHILSNLQNTTKLVAEKLESFLSHSLAEARRVDENTSDGYHTFKELYEFRKLYNAALFNEWAAQGKYNVHKSFKHHDGKNCFDGGWFIVMATLPTGQISNHYENKDWKLFKCEERFKADEWDGHTAQDVAKRLSDLLTGDNPEEAKV